MNFLLHRHLGERDLGSTRAGFGAMLPDLWRMADRRVRPGPAARAAEPAREALREILLGVEHHLIVDRWFHKDAVFVVGERETTVRLREANLTSRHATMFAHVLWELCLDGALVRREADAVLVAVTDGLRGAGDAALDAANRLHFSQIARSSSERERFEERLRHICSEVAKGPWVLAYASGEGIARRIDGVRSSLGLGAMTESDIARLRDVASSLARPADENLDEILRTPSFLDRSAS